MAQKAKEWNRSSYRVHLIDWQPPKMMLWSIFKDNHFTAIAVWVCYRILDFVLLEKTYRTPQESNSCHILSVTVRWAYADRPKYCSYRFARRTTALSFPSFMLRMEYPKLCQSMTRNVCLRYATSCAIAKVGIAGGFLSLEHISRKSTRIPTCPNLYEDIIGPRCYASHEPRELQRDKNSLEWGP